MYYFHVKKAIDFVCVCVFIINFFSFVLLSRLQNTPLHVATIENQPNAVELLLKLECHLLYNFNGFSAIDFALQSKHTEVVNVMVTHPTR